MPVRKILLLIMLVALAATALTGAFAFLTASDELLGRLLGTCFATAAVTAFLLPLSYLTDKPKLRQGGLLAMATLMIAWLCILAMIWEIHFGSQLEWRLLSTLGFTLLAGLPAAAALQIKSNPWARIASWTFVGLAAYAWLVCMAGSWLAPSSGSWGGPSELATRLWATATIPYGIGTLCCFLLVNVEMKDRRYFRWLGIAAGMAAIIIALGAVWTDVSGHSWERALASCLSACGVLAHINLVMMAKLRGNQQWLKWLTIAMSLTAGICVIIAAAVGTNDESFLFRAAGAAAIAAGCSSIALVVLTALNRRVDIPLTPSVEMKTIHMQCPRCHANQSLPIGEGVCTSCQLQIFTHITEPRCPACGYNLYKLTSNRCPECGGPITPPTAAIPTSAPTPDGPHPLAEIALDSMRLTASTAPLEERNTAP